jgi:hypothetical protein
MDFACFSGLAGGADPACPLAVAAASTWVEVSSALVSVAIHSRETTSGIAIETRLARVQ